ncbi:MAG: hypothetical protein AB8H03_07030 [Saprospiraceae bacterium]
MDFSKIKSSLVQITKEMIPVILGILIALWFNNWQKNKEDKIFVSHVFQSIQKEHAENIEELQKIIPLHERFGDSIVYYIEDDNVILGQLIQIVGGLKIVFIGNTSWKSFIGNDIRLLDYQIVKYLSLIDEQKNLYQRQTHLLSDFMLEKIYSKKDLDKSIFLGLLNDLLSTEKDLLKDHLELQELFKVIDGK